MIELGGKKLHQTLRGAETTFPSNHVLATSMYQNAKNAAPKRNVDMTLYSICRATTLLDIVLPPWKP